MNKEFINNILNVLFTMCHAEGGDGDATWYTNVFSIEEIMACIKEYNKQTKFPWEIELDNNTIYLSAWPEECVVITSNIEIFKNRPTYARIEY